MSRTRTFALAAFALLALSWTSAHAGVFIGIGGPGPYYRPYHHRYWYGPRVVVGLPPVYISSALPPVYVAPAPRVYVTPVAPAPVYLPPAPTTQSAAPPAQEAQAPPTLPSAPIPVGRN